MNCDQEFILHGAEKTLVVNRDDSACKVESSSVSVDLKLLSLIEHDIIKFQEFLKELGEVYSDKPELIHVVWHEIDMDSLRNSMYHPSDFRRCDYAYLNLDFAGFFVQLYRN